MATGRADTWAPRQPPTADCDGGAGAGGQNGHGDGNGHGDRPSRRHVVGIVVLEGTLALDTAVAVQVFGPRPSAFAAIRDEAESPYEVVVCGGSASDIRSVGFAAGGLEPWDRLATVDTVVVPGLDEPEHPRDPEGLAAIRAAAARGARLVGLCTGTFVLGHAGVLSGRRATTHWALADEFRRCFPDVDLLDDELFVDDGQVLSSGGMLAAADCCLHILRRDLGQAYANDVSRLLVSPPHRTGGQTQYRTSRGVAAAGTLGPLMAWALDHLDEELTLSTLAAKAHLSTRTLSRRFEAETGRGALYWLTERRVERARALLEGTAVTVTDVAFASGFGSLAAFRRQFARHTGTTPRAYRQTFTDRSPVSADERDAATDPPAAAGAGQPDGQLAAEAWTPGVAGSGVSSATAASGSSTVLASAAGDVRSRV
jgi:AraC family transcriptional regulator, transcriptional activator FtrA